MRKRKTKKTCKLAGTTRIPMDPVGELAHSNISFRANVKIKVSNKPTLKEFVQQTSKEFAQQK